MSDDTIVPFDEAILRLPSCVALHAQLRSNLAALTSDEYAKLDRAHVCGIVRKTDSETTVIALAAYRCFPSTFDTIRFQIDDLVVDANERNHGLGTRLLQHLIAQAKQIGVKQISFHCEPTNTDAHRLLFRLGFTIVLFEFYQHATRILAGSEHIRVIDVTDLPAEENEKYILDAQDVFRQLRPHLPADQTAFLAQIRETCRAGPARLILALSETNEVLGLAVFRLTQNVKFSKHIYCDDLVTNEQKRSTGVGRSLINYMKNEVQKAGLDPLVLDSGCQRGRAHKFYHREGFVISRLGFALML